MKGRSSLLTVGVQIATRRVVRLFDATPLRLARPDCAKDMDDSAERH
jgi:hypothetical protein